MSSRKLTIFLLALVLLASGSAAQAYTNVNVGISFGFHDVLAPYGAWVQTGSYGPCWRPRASAAFIPFTSGHWIYTSYGPTWVGTEPWAWCAYHYGHWVPDPVNGWVWVPGYTWSPAPVEFAYGADYLAWSPYAGGGSNFNFWIGIDRAHFGYANYSGYVLPRTTVRTLFDRRVVRVHSGMLQRAELERIVRRPVRVERVEEQRVVADRHATRLILPEGQRATAMREISRVRHERTMPASATRTHMQKRAEKRVNFVAPSSHPSMAARSRMPERTVTRKSNTAIHSTSRKAYTQGSRYTEPARSYTPHHSTTRTSSSHSMAPRRSASSHPVTPTAQIMRSYRPEGSAHSSHTVSRNTARVHQSSRSQKPSKANTHKKPPQ